MASREKFLKKLSTCCLGANVVCAFALALPVLTARAAPTPQTQPSDFCAGFTEGYKSTKGEAATVPACPNERGVPRGSSSFREGVKAGIQAGRQKK